MGDGEWGFWGGCARAHVCVSRRGGGELDSLFRFNRTLQLGSALNVALGSSNSS